MNRKAIAGLMLAAALAMAALPGCGAGKEEAVKVRIGEVTRSVFYAPQYVALAEGFFKEEGLDVELQTTAGGDKTMTALLSGGVDVALVGPETSIYVYQQGADDPVLSFAQVTQTDGTFLVSRSGKPLDWNDLKGAKFLGQRKGGMPQMAGEFALKKHGIDPHADLDLIQNIDFANITAAYASGTGDYVQLFEPQASMIEQEGKGKVVASFGVESGKLPYTAFMSKQSYIEKNADTVQKFTDALQKAQTWVKEHSAEDIADAVGTYFPNTDKAILVSSIDRYKQQGSYAENPIIDEQEWNNLLDVMTSAGELKERAEHGKLVDNSFAEKAGK
ncbi:ABC transporter substrate-binding protein [Paenibacillus pasadenensis]|uniref:ABC transporter substrate-binding protein n=1 Tax=Paenibacillus pasadenensis TaxID=217090 RepID=A0A2N5N662_9BACL|nr:MULTISPECIES: ABC transporter substrate-binding protein [Paenibacillus]PLT45793.1 ABC transporter substrate-binding protein [Paenibacillus pasadenensis]QGG56230.1 PhnD/SsuA/transferrin family substrate-binding protein [Paenibacillus sp. B01]